MADSRSSALGALLGLCLVLGAVDACRSSQHRGEGTRAPSPRGVVATSATPSSGVAAVPSASASSEASTLDDARARSFVTRWAQAQNAHDFAAYGALYAERFTGLKRVGDYAKRFDRRGWLKDRQPMFREGTSVQVSEIQVSLSPSAARVVLTQDFSAPGFHDSGQKELLLTAVAGGIVISREEMLVSRVAASPPSSNGAVLAFHRDGPVLGSGAGSGAPKGQPRLLARAADDRYDVAVALSTADVEEATRGWLGRSVTAYAKDGARCSGVVTRFELRVSAQPHFGMIQAWNGETGQPRATAVQIAADIWGIARDDERFVVGVLDHQCHGVWAMEGALPWVAAQSAPPPLRASALAAFKALPRYRELQAEFVTQTADGKHGWEEVDGEISVVQVRPASEPAIVIVSASGGVSCNAFSARLNAIWKVAQGGSLDLRQVVETGDLLRVHGALEPAGAPLELLTGPDGLSDEVSVLQPTAAGYERRLLFSTSFWDCGC